MYATAGQSNIHSRMFDEKMLSPDHSQVSDEGPNGSLVCNICFPIAMSFNRLFNLKKY